MKASEESSPQIARILESSVSTGEYGPHHPLNKASAELGNNLNHPKEPPPYLLVASTFAFLANGGARRD